MLDDFRTFISDFPMRFPPTRGCGQGTSRIPSFTQVLAKRCGVRSLNPGRHLGKGQLSQSAAFGRTLQCEPYIRGFTPRTQTPCPKLARSGEWPNRARATIEDREHAWPPGRWAMARKRLRFVENPFAKVRWELPAGHRGVVRRGGIASWATYHINNIRFGLAESASHEMATFETECKCIFRSSDRFIRRKHRWTVNNHLKVPIH